MLEDTDRLAISKMPQKTNGFASVIRDNDSLKLFLKKMGQFDEMFCKSMNEGSDFTISLEVRGNCGELLHVQVRQLDIERPNGADKRIEKKKESA